MKNNYKPEIRFSGLSGDWNLRKIEELLQERNEQIPANEKFPLMSFTATEGVTPKSDRYNREFLVKSANKKYKKTKRNDLIYSSNNLEVGSIGLNKTGNAVISPVYSIFYVKDGITPDFMGILIRRKSIINKMLRYRQGVVYGQWRIHESDFLSIETLIPLIEEQTKIGEFFKQLDEVISFHQQELTKLKQAKYGFLQKMFPREGEFLPELRFPGFDSEWGERKLGEISFKVKEKNLEGIYSETLTNSAELGIINQREFFDKDISNKKNLGGYYVVRPDDFVYNPRISNLAPVGPVKRNKLGKTGVMSPLYYVFRTKGVDKAYLENFFSSTRWHEFMKLNGDSGARSDRFAIKDSVFSEMPIPFPSLDEQAKIGDFFKRLDETIALHQQELDALKQTKKAFLQKMFV